MKIALVTETHPPEINGAAKTLHVLVEGLAGRGHSASDTGRSYSAGPEN